MLWKTNVFLIILCDGRNRHPVLCRSTHPFARRAKIWYGLYHRSSPRKLSDEERLALIMLSNQVTKLLELRKKNMLIRERAAEIIELKSNAVRGVFA